MSLPALIRDRIKRLAKRFGYRIVRDTPALWTLPSVHMRSNWIARILADGPVTTVLDVGGNDGKSVQWLSDAFPNAHICTFEPYPPSFERLRANIAKYPRVEAFNVALGDDNGTATYHANTKPGTGSLLPNSEFIATFTPPHKVQPIGSLTVAVERLDTFCSRHGIEKIDVLKIDTQGYERLILDGAGDMLYPEKIRGLFLEMLFVSLYQNQTWPHEILGLLHERGYRLFGFSGVNFGFEHGWRWADAMFVANELAVPEVNP